MSEKHIDDQPRAEDTYEELKAKVAPLVDEFLQKVELLDPSKINIIVLGMGGTFQCPDTDEGRAPSSGKLQEIFNQLNISTRPNVELKLLELMSLDSSELTVDHWRVLAESIIPIIAKLREKGYKKSGFIITHGTDTMDQGASTISFMLGRGLKVPIILTGSQEPALKSGSDGPINIERAVWTIELAIQQNIAEVMVLCGETAVRGTRAIKISDIRPNAYASFDGKALLDFTQTADPRKLKFPDFALKPNMRTPFLPFTNLSRYLGVAEMSMKGISPDIFKTLIRASAASIVQLLGSATAPDVLVNELVKSNRAGKLLVLRSPFPDAETAIGTYAAGSALAKENLPYINGSIPTIQTKTLYIMREQGIKPIKSEKKGVGLVFRPEDQSSIIRRLVQSVVGEW